jgi:hypothetical protein
MKLTQVSYQFYYRLRKKLGRTEFSKKLVIQPEPLHFKKAIYSSPSYSQETNSFTFLNKSRTCIESIDWDFAEHGKLWTYNLNYFDFLNQEGLSKEVGLSLIQHYINSSERIKNGMEPYPISLRGINWIKFLSRNKIQDQTINQCLYNHYYTLLNNREFHLLGNHLLENGFSLFFGAYYFKDISLLKASISILKRELKEQILQDGAHFELSPMYHQIILNRLLDCINISKSNCWSAFNDLELLSNYAQSMLGWLETITYCNGNIPMVNDSTNDIAPCSKSLFEYAKRLELSWGKSILSDSGYRKWECDEYELLMDVGEIGPDYIPGHAHADTFNFELFINKKPFIVDTGISTYEKNHTRQSERSTQAHNTVVCANENSSQVWSGFRVAERARITKFLETQNKITSEHNGYKKQGLIHQRSFHRGEKKLLIEDNLIGKTAETSYAYLHFHPSISRPRIIEKKITFSNFNTSIEFSDGCTSIQEVDYNYCMGFNKAEKGFAVKVEFHQHLKTIINI